MARISTYSKDLIVTKDDKVIGSDASGSITKNYTLGGIGKFLGDNGLVVVHTQAMYQLSSTPGEKKFTGATNSTSFASAPTLQFSKIDGAEHNIQNFILEYRNRTIIIFQSDDKNSYGIYKVTELAQDSSDNNFYNFTLEFVSGNGSFIIDKYYAVALLGEGDKHYVHTQSASSITWSIQHNLNKHPSVTVALDTGQKGYGDVNYTSKNNLTITFAEAGTGKAYMN
jgi:hypothetical protein